MKKTLERNKNKEHPKRPRSIEDIPKKFSDPYIIERYGYNLESDFRFYVDTVIKKEFAFTIFASQFTINFVKENIAPQSRHYLMDGTFDSLPGNFYQLLIIAIEYRNDVSRIHTIFDYLPVSHIVVQSPICLVDHPN